MVGESGDASAPKTVATTYPLIDIAGFAASKGDFTDLFSDDNGGATTILGNEAALKLASFEEDLKRTISLDDLVRMEEVTQRESSGRKKSHDAKSPLKSAEEISEEGGEPSKSAVEEARARERYQMDPANYREGIIEMKDSSEGADILLVKYGLPYLDIIRLSRDNSSLPIAAFQMAMHEMICRSDSEHGGSE